MAEKQGEVYQVLQLLLLQQARIHLFLQPVFVVRMGLHTTTTHTQCICFVVMQRPFTHAVKDSSDGCMNVCAGCSLGIKRLSHDALSHASCGS